MTVPSNLLLLCCLLGFTACQTDLIHDQTLMPEEEGWSYNEPLTFDFQVQDTSLHYEFLLDVSHNRDYPFQNLYTRITTHFPDQSSQENIVSLELANQIGLWEGQCKGENCKLTIALQEKARFNQPGHYQLRFEQHTRQDSLPGINSLRLRIISPD